MMDAFVMPEWDADIAIRRAAYDRLSSIKLTIEQLEEGYDIFRRIGESPIKPNFEVQRMEDLLAFCELEGLLPADVAAHAIMIRGQIFETFWSGGVDPKVEWGDRYPQLAELPINPEELGYDLAELLEQESA